ncbi:MSP (Major sperm protein) domain containing protein [Trypanosoma brucei equiperdum]|uniref:MSP (Major sperm protein) domain containing protein n=1 Tax=Trypanosoma brucei equiperdum TaxID=630700 RepID=A0A3L6KTB4_9TRYP|nr:MSP (Major sperm protein) domain containing protein [Trypanosoma brucei equiperdum]
MRSKTAAPSVIVTPDRLHMTAKRKEECLVQITNISFEKVLFRMLTTTPERYLVKPTKGVIEPSASASVLITLSPTTARGEDVSDVNATDDFRLEYCLQEPEDCIEPRCTNVPALIKEKKQQDRRLVHSKTVRCTVDLTAVNGKWGEVRLRDDGNGSGRGSKGKNVISAVLNSRKREEVPGQVKASLAGQKQAGGGNSLMWIIGGAATLFCWWWFAY